LPALTTAAMAASRNAATVAAESKLVLLSASSYCAGRLLVTIGSQVTFPRKMRRGVSRTLIAQPPIRVPGDSGSLAPPPASARPAERSSLAWPPFAVRTWPGRRFPSDRLRLRPPFEALGQGA